VNILTPKHQYAAVYQETVKQTNILQKKSCLHYGQTIKNC